MRSLFRAGVAALVLVSAAYFFVLPARTYLAQKRAIALEENTIQVLRTENSKLSAERAALNTKATIEQIGRQDYGLVKPGQQAFMVLPSATPSASAQAAPTHTHHWYSELEIWDDL